MGNNLDEQFTPDRKVTSGRSGAPSAVSARKLAALLYQSAASTDYCGVVRRRRGLLDRCGYASCSSLPVAKFDLESITKWTYCQFKASASDSHFHSNSKLFLRNQENQDTCAKIKHLKNEIKREKKLSEEINFLNSKLVNDIAEAKLSALKFRRTFEKEKKARVCLEDSCSDLAKEIEEKKGVIEALRKRCGRIEKEVEEERKMLQLAEIWREERTQMKLVDAKLILEEKYCQMNTLIADIEAFLSSSNLTLNCYKNTHNQETRKSPSEISSVSLEQREKKGSSLCKTIDMNKSVKVSNESISSVISQDDVAVKEHYVERQWPSREARNPHIIRAMKGDVEWPRRILRKHFGSKIGKPKNASAQCT